MQRIFSSRVISTYFKCGVLINGVPGMLDLLECLTLIRGFSLVRIKCYRFLWNYRLEIFREEL